MRELPLAKNKNHTDFLFFLRGKKTHFPLKALRKLWHFLSYFISSHKKCMQNRQLVLQHICTLSGYFRLPKKRYLISEKNEMSNQRLLQAEALFWLSLSKDHPREHSCIIFLPAQFGMVGGWPWASLLVTTSSSLFKGACLRKVSDLDGRSGCMCDESHFTLDLFRKGWVWLNVFDLGKCVFWKPSIGNLFPFPQFIF